MAPVRTETRLAELELKCERVEVLVGVFKREFQISDEKMEALKSDVAVVKLALFGDPSDSNKRPGLISEVRRLEMKQDQANEILSDIRRDIRYVAMAVVGAVIAGILKLVVMH
jgi:hypothetical protein